MEDRDKVQNRVIIEKATALIFMIEQFMDFMIEYDIQPDEETKKTLLPLVYELHEWLNE